MTALLRIASLASLVLALLLSPAAAPGAGLSSAVRQDDRSVRRGRSGRRFRPYPSPSICPTPSSSLS